MRVNRRETGIEAGTPDYRFQEGKPMLRKVILIAAACGIAITASACNTVKGVGRDIESVGEAGARAI